MKHTTRLTACLLALALTACTAAPQNNERDFLYRLLKEPNIRKRSRSEI